MSAAIRLIPLPVTCGSEIILMGLRAAGKSTVGVAVARRAGLRLIEIDVLAAQAHGCP
jgi:shikimate kinase